MEKKKILVCGATGFIGRNVAEHFSQRNDFEVYGTYNSSPKYQNSKINLLKVDLTKKEETNALIKGMDIVIQTAAVSSGAKDILSKHYIHAIDSVAMSSFIFRAAHEQGVSHVLFPSCSIIYPSDLNRALKEEDYDPLKISKEYSFGAKAKIYLETLCEDFAKLNKTKFTVFRHSNVYGPHDKFDLERSHVFGATMTKVMQAKDSINVWGTGEAERDLLYVSDIVDFIEKAIEKQKEKYVLVNLGCSSPISIKDLAQKIISASGKPLIINYDTSKPTINTKLFLDYNKAKSLFDWNPKVSFDEGIHRTMSWYKQNIMSAQQI